MEEARRLYRSHDGYLGGVCAGIAERLNLDAVVVRIFAVLLAASTVGLGALAYLIMWIALPIAPAARLPYEVEPENVDSKTYGCVDCDQVRGKTLAECNEFSHEEGLNTPLRVGIAVALVLLFIAISNVVCPFVKGTAWWEYWPLALMIAGFALIVVPIARENTIFWHLIGVVLVFLGGSLMPITLGYFSVFTINRALLDLWPLLAFSLAAFIIGVRHDYAPIGVLGTVLFAAFCILMITSYAVPGIMDDIVLVMPDGNSYLFRTPLS